MNIKSLKANQIHLIEPLLSNWSHHPLAFLHNKIHCDPAHYCFDEISETANSENCDIICSEQDGDISGCIILCDLPWDSAYFQKPMSVIKYFLTKEGYQAGDFSEILLEAAIEKAKSRKQDFILCKCDTDNLAVIRSLESKGFRMVDTMLNYMYDYKNPPFAEIAAPLCNTGISVRIADKHDCDELMQLSCKAFGKHFGRFHADTHIKREDATGVYGQWLKSSCHGWADWIIVAENKDQIMGFSVWKKPSRRDLEFDIRLGHYSIGAIDPSCHKQGLFALLTYEGMRTLEPECDYIDGPTHINNYGVQRGYAKLGWKICGGKHSFHKWL
jgi:GNAT superfamily N-acetyltransferase